MRKEEWRSVLIVKAIRRKKERRREVRKKKACGYIQGANPMNYTFCPSCPQTDKEFSPVPRPSGDVEMNQSSAGHPSGVKRVHEHASEPFQKTVRTSGESRGAVSTTVNMDVDEVEWSEIKESLLEERTPMVRWRDGDVKKGWKTCDIQHESGLSCMVLDQLSGSFCCTPLFESLGLPF